MYIDNFLKNSYNLSNNVSSKDKDRIKEILYDYIGVAFAGFKFKKNMIFNYSRTINKSNQIYDTKNVFKFVESKEPLEAALILGISSHILDMDDGSNNGIIHLASPIISAVIASRNIIEFSWDTFCKAVIVGYEVALRIAKTIQPSHKLKGFHATGTCGTIGAAAATAVIFDLSLTDFIKAVYIGASSSSGILKVIEGDSDLKALNIGRASMNGLNSSIVAASGFNTPENFFMGNNGFFEVMANSINLSELDIGSDLAIYQTYTKLHGACRYCHPSIDASLKLKSCVKNFLDIKEIIIETYSLAINNHDHILIEGSTSAKMSIPYSVAISLINGSADLKDFSIEFINDVNVISLTEKVKVKEKKEYSNIFPKFTPSKVSIFMNNGDIFTEYVDIPKGEPLNPLTQAETFNKFKQLMTFSGLDVKEINELSNLLFSNKFILSDIYKF